jgi:hypothetical protein
MSQLGEWSDSGSDVICDLETSAFFFAGDVHVIHHRPGDAANTHLLSCFSRSIPCIEQNRLRLVYPLLP